jgi:DNA topoisomerase-1
VTDEAVLDRIRALVIPPAWGDVWICPWPNGHIQAVGTDAAGRRQYRYHDDWRKKRDHEKYERMVEFGHQLPTLRSTVTADLARPGMGKRRVVAATVRLIDLGCFRVGGEEYVEDNDTFGVATLRREHVKLHQEELVFEYPAKGSIVRSVTINDSNVAAVVCTLRRRRDGDANLFAWKDKGGWNGVRSADINAYIKDEIGEQFSAKDFRTWSATVYAAVTLAGCVETGRSQRATSKAVADAAKKVADYLGNTPAVCRSSYIDPRLIDRFVSGETIHAISGSVDDVLGDPKRRRELEDSVLELMSDLEAAAA